MELMEARKLFAKASAPARAERSGSNNSFGGFIDKRDNYVEVGTWVCHGWLQTYNIEQRSWIRGGAKYVLSAVMSSKMAKPDLVRFIDWLVNRSPYARVFVDKDVNSILEYGYLVDADYPAVFITSAMICSRFPTEAYHVGETFNKRNLVWKELLEIGCTENEAYFFAHLYDASSHKDVYPITPSRMSSGHIPFHGSCFQEDYVRNFLNGTPIIPDGMGRLSNGKGYQDGTINNLWGRAGSSDAFWNKMRALVPVSNARSKDHNIFRVVVSKNGFQYNNRADFLSVITQLKELIQRA